MAMNKALTKDQLARLIRPVYGFEGLYEVSALGDVYSLRRRTRYTSRPHDVPVLVRPGMVKGYPRVGLSKNSKRICRYVHHLVMEAFYGPAPPNLECAHLDGDRANCCVLNLAWVTRKSNARHSLTHGTKPRGSDVYRAVLIEADILKIRSDPRPDKLVCGDYGVSQYAIYAVRKGLTWKHIR